MLTKSFALIMLLCFSQQPETPKLGRIQVLTRENSSIVFEYAYRFVREGEPVSDESLKLLRKELMLTDLFTAVRIDVRPTLDGQQVNMNIVPYWRSRPGRFRIERVVFVGFEGIDEKRVYDYLKKHDLGPGSLLLKNSFPKIKSILHEAVEAVYQDAPNDVSYFGEKLILSRFIVQRSRPGSFLIIVCADSNKECDHTKLKRVARSQLKNSGVSLLSQSSEAIVQLGAG